MPVRKTHNDRLGRALTSDVFVFEEPERIYGTLNVIFVTILVGAVALAVAAYVVNWRMTFNIAITTAVAFCAVVALLKIGYSRLAGLLMLATLMTAATYSICRGDGIHDIAIVLYPAIILVGSLLLNTRFYAVLTLLALASVNTIGVLEIEGVIKNKYSDLFGYADVIMLNILLVAEAVVIRVLALVIMNSLLRAHRSERNYREIFNATSEAILLHDEVAGTILDVNETTLAMFGYRREEILNLIPGDLTPDEKKLSPDEIQRTIQRAVEEGPQVFEWLMCRKDGTTFWAEVALRNTEIGGEGRILAVVRDVDARKRMEERLRQSEKMEAVGELAGGIAHDFNNQLAGIVGFADLVRSEMDDDAEFADSVDRILVAARRAADLTTQLLAFARRGKYESAAVDVHTLVDEVVALLRHSIDKRITIEQTLRADPSLTLGDPSQLQSAILNLTINARDAMPDGGTLTIATQTLELADGDEMCAHNEIPPGRYVQISVSDTGTGMDPETERRVFEPFFTTKEKGRGTGMGLAAVYGTVKNHDGAIAVYSEPGRGATFRVLLPAHVGPAAANDRPAERLPELTGSSLVLVVDDEEAVCNVAARMLAQMGCKAVVREDGAAALEYYRESWRDIDLVVLDMSMPKMSGRDTFMAMRNVNPGAAVLLMSGFSLNDDVQALLDAGARGFIQKPFWKNEFTRLVAETLQVSPGNPGPDSLQ
jgi:PAS domain S-box-containing protein